MSFSRSISFLAVAVVAACVVPPALGLTRNHYVGLLFSQTPDGAGGLDYGLEVIHAIAVANNVSGKLIAPDGTEFVMFGPDEVERSSFAEIASLAFGDWTAIEEFDGQQLTYQFHMPAFSLDSVFTDVPVVTSPAPGSQVPTQFQVNWGFQNGSMPNGSGFTYQKSSNLIVPNVDFSLPGCCAVEFTSQFVGPGPGTISFQARQSSVVADPTLIGGSPLPGDFFRFFPTTFISKSAFATYTVVPEPTSLVLASVVGIILGTLCGGRRSACVRQ